MKVRTLEEQYMFSYKLLSIVMPIASIFFISIGILLSVLLKEVFWCGLILVGIGIMTIVGLVFIRKYILKKVNQLKKV